MRAFSATQQSTPDIHLCHISFDFSNGVKAF
jgi:hypothetical protein